MCKNSVAEIFLTFCNCLLHSNASWLTYLPTPVEYRQVFSVLTPCVSLRCIHCQLPIVIRVSTCDLAVVTTKCKRFHRLCSIVISTGVHIKGHPFAADPFKIAYFFFHSKTACDYTFNTLQKFLEVTSIKGIN